MYGKIFGAPAHTGADASLLPHVQEFARRFESELVLLHVADGWVARHYDSKLLQPAESEEMKDDRSYIEAAAARLAAAGVKATPQLALGNPPTEILRVAERERCDLIAMTSHGHRLLADIFLGSTIETVRHRTNIPILVVRAEQR